MSKSENEQVSQKSLNIRGYYSPGEDVTLEGDRMNLERFASILSSDNFPVTYVLDVPGDMSPAPYESFLKAITFLSTDTLIQIEVEREVLVIRGASPKLNDMAQHINDFLNLAASTPRGPIKNHAHIEYFDEHWYLAPSAFPLVISLDD